MHNIYFTRHGETVWNVENKICGMTDSPLTACGSSALANTRARPGTVRSSASPRPTLPTAMTAAKA